MTRTTGEVLSLITTSEGKTDISFLDQLVRKTYADMADAVLQLDATHMIKALDKLIPSQDFEALVLEHRQLHMARCEDCQKTWWVEELTKVDFGDALREGRIALGEIMPAGECPECGAFCHLMKETDDESGT